MSSADPLMAERSPASPWRMLWVDFPSFMAAAFTLAVVGLGIALALFGGIPGMLGRDGLGQEDLPYFLTFGSLVLIICLPLLWLRLYWLSGLLRRGKETPGTILQFYRARNGSRLKFSYRFDGKAYIRSVRTPTWQDGLVDGIAITVILDPQRPRRALIKKLYF